MATSHTFDLENGATIILHQNVISDRNVDVIVNLAYTNLDLVDRCSLANHIPEEALREIQQECLSKAPMGLELGEYVVTNVGTAFKSCFIYHCACWTESEGERLTFTEFINLLSECFDSADSMKQRSIVVPVIGIDAFKREETDGQKDLVQLLVLTFLSIAADAAYSTKTLILNIDKDSKRLFETCRRILKELSDQETDDIKVHYPKNTASPDIPQAPPRRKNRNISPMLPSTGKLIHDDCDSVNMPVLPPSEGNGARPKQKPTKSTVAHAQTQSVSKDIEMKSSEKGPAKQTTLLKVYKGDITNVKVEAIVHGAYGINNNVTLTGAVGSALALAGGKLFQNECKNTGGHLEEIAFAITTGGDMRYTHVIHVNTSHCRTDADWQSLIKGCLEEAEKLNIKSLAFPGIRTDYIKPLAQASNFKTVIEKYIKDGRDHIKEIHIVLYDDATTDLYKRILNWMPVTPVQKTTQMAPSSNVCTEFTVVYKGVTIVVKEGNIADENVGCVVHGYKVISSTKQITKISLLDPIGKLLVQKAGNMFKENCEREYMLSGSSVITPGASTFDKVLHIDTTLYALYGQPNWESFIVRCLQKGEIDAIKSISFPFIGLVSTANIQKLANVQISGVKTYINSGTRLEEIRFVINDDAVVLKAFQDSIEAIIGSSEHEADFPTSDKLAGSLRMEVKSGDITKDDSHMIVHGTTHSGNGIHFHGNLGKALTDAGGTTFVRECSETHISPNKFVVTTAGLMKSRFVIHADTYTINFHQKDKWKQIVGDILKEADRRNMVSIAFPPLGMVDATLPDGKMMISYLKEAFIEFEASNPRNLSRIRFLIHNDNSLLKLYQEVLLDGTHSQSDQGIGASVRATIVPTKSADIKHVVTLYGSYGELDITIVRGDLTKETTDCIVHATQNPISFNGQSGRALKDAGGPEFEKACGSASFGMFTNKNTVLTKAGSLPCKQVLHLAMPTAQGLFDNKLKMVTAYVLECLHVANDEKIKSISFPALGTGQWRCKPAEVAKCFETAINKFNSKRTKGYLNEIRLVVFKQLMMDEFTEQLLLNSYV